LKRLGRVNHNYPSQEDVLGAANDRLCRNVVARFLMKFLIEAGGDSLAGAMAERGWGDLPGRKMPSISHLPILQVISDDDGDDGKDKEGTRALRR